MSIVNELWVEKYRPKTIDDVVLPNEVKEEFKNTIQAGTLSNLLLAGPPGAGKSTLARILTSKNGLIQKRKDNVLEINGSAKETRGISFIQDTMEPFLKIPPAGNDNYKVIFIDEGDNLTDASFSSLRGIIEKYQIKYGRFIITCNYINKIPEPIQSRFTIYKFKQLPLEYVTKYCENILQSENITWSNEDLQHIISNLYPDIRKIVTCMERCTSSGSLRVNRNEILSHEKVIIALFIELLASLKDGNKTKMNLNMNEIMKMLDEHDLEYNNLYESLFFTKGLPVQAKIVINKYSSIHQNALSHEMNFMAMIFECITTYSSYLNSVSK